MVAAPGNAVPRMGAVSGQAILRFVVDTLGRAELSTVEVGPGSEAALARALRRALPRYRFLPAVGPAGGPVRQVVEWSAVARELNWGYDVQLRLSTDPPFPP